MMMRKDLLKNIIKIVRCIEESKDWIWYREIERRTGVHHKTVSRLIDKHLSMFLDYQTIEPFKLRMVRLKPNTDVNGILRYLAVKERIENSRKALKL